MSGHRSLIRLMQEFEHVPKNLKQISDRTCEKDRHKDRENLGANKRNAHS
ncbi:hypothetical protein FHW03_000022 [Ochrobactrum sp. RH2CCR150]|nr:hypothetical protein [Ochrobactrum sp. RH2CCR150]